MIFDGSKIPNGKVISAQVCIVGSGPAGITAAYELQQAGIDVILIEGSRWNGTQRNESWQEKPYFYNGEATGLFTHNEPEFLIRPTQQYSQGPWERERVYGGTSTHWGGQCRPLDPIVFTKRPGFPGWPINRQDLDPYYSRAAELCQLHTDNFTSQYWAQVLQADVPALAGFNPEMYQFIGPDYTNFATRNFNGMPLSQANLDIILNANLLEIDHQQGSVNGLRIASADSGSPPQKLTEFTIKAERYVLACGAVANARQLLLSNVGNEHDLVGRYFMCHPDVLAQAVTITGNYLSSSEMRYMAGQLPNGQPWRDANGVYVQARFTPNADAAVSHNTGRCWFHYDGGHYYFEMTPNPNSRITLSDTKDPVFGQPQTRIDWQFSEGDEHTYQQTTQLFKSAVNQLGGDVSFIAWDSIKNQVVVNGHHIGTTRMSNDPEQGVVDANLKVHSLDNLYVAGSSVFPSTGVSNPTFTIITLSIRLAEHITQAIQGGNYG